MYLQIFHAALSLGRNDVEVSDNQQRSPFFNGGSILGGILKQSDQSLQLSMHFYSTQRINDAESQRDDLILKFMFNGKQLLKSFKLTVTSSSSHLISNGMRNQYIFNMHRDRAQLVLISISKA
ncbi:uncharacterized protein LOC143559163 [Bidens hawaiensis]|uniref:uncharacterized protein LOC143559163 n=1 Tax=Bidens hawaiensis TaxID=980011 RepID=UPI00404AB3FF